MKIVPSILLMAMTLVACAQERQPEAGEWVTLFDGESFAGHALHAGLVREARHWNSRFEYRETTPTFRADAGFVTRNNERRLTWNNNLVFYPNNLVFNRIQPNVVVTERRNFNGVRKACGVENWIDFALKGQTRVSLGYDRGEERFRGVSFDGIDLYYGEFNNDYFEWFRFGFWFGFGDRIARTAYPAPFLGSGGLVDLWGTIKLGSRFAAEPLLTWSALNTPTGEEFFDGFIGRVRLNYQLTRELSLRMVTQYDDFAGELSVEPLVTWQLNPFTVFYVGASVHGRDYGHDSIDPAERMRGGFARTAWQAFFKFQYFYRL